MIELVLLLFGVVIVLYAAVVMLSVAFAVLEAFAAFCVGLVLGMVEIICLPFKCIDAIFGEKKPEPPPAPRRQPPPPPPPVQESRYTSDWSSVARRYKEYRYWSCEVCGVYCGETAEHRRLLHVHHINLDSLDNAEWNLAALCIQCHGSMDGVGHKRLRGAAMNDGRWYAVDILKRRQGIS